MTGGIKDLAASERGVFAFLLLLCATAMGVMGKLTADQWIDFAKWLGGALILSKTVTTAVETVALKKSQAPPADFPFARTVKDPGPGSAPTPPEAPAETRTADPSTTP